jgi:uncharacterized protein (DUF697 family)
LDKNKLAKLKEEVEEFGGIASFKNGDWLLKLIQKIFSTYYKNATPEFFAAKYPGLDHENIYKKLRKAAVRQSGLAGAASGFLVSANEIVALLTGGEGVVGIPANISAAFLTIAGELLIVTKIQLELVSRIARLYGAPLDLDDPEDVWIVLAVALGGELAQEAGKYGIEIGARVTRSAVRGLIRGETLAYLKRLAAKIGFKLLQRTIISATVPVVSIAVGTIWNRWLTGRIAAAAKKHFSTIAAERNGIQQLQS